MKLKLDKIRRAVSFPAVIDMVFYKDGEENLYRLLRIREKSVRTELETFHHVMCLGQYAPEVIEGEVILDSERQMEIMDKDEKVYYIEKNAEELKFWEIGKMTLEC